MTEETGITSAPGSGDTAAMDAKDAAAIMQQARERAGSELRIRRPVLFVTWGLAVRKAGAATALEVAAGVMAFLAVWTALFLLQRQSLSPLRRSKPRFPTPPDESLSGPGRPIFGRGIVRKGHMTSGQITYNRRAMRRSGGQIAFQGGAEAGSDPGRAQPGLEAFRLSADRRVRCGTGIFEQAEHDLAARALCPAAHDPAVPPDRGADVP